MQGYNIFISKNQLLTPENNIQLIFQWNAKQSILSCVFESKCALLICIDIVLYITFSHTYVIDRDRMNKYVVDPDL